VPAKLVRARSTSRAGVESSAGPRSSATSPRYGSTYADHEKCGRAPLTRSFPRAATLLAEAPAEAWQRLSCGDGSKGPRLFDWAIRPINSPEPDEYARWLLIRRDVEDPNEVAYFLCGGRPGTTLEQLVAVAGVRWAIEDGFALAKGDCGLDHYEVRSWTGWYRHVTLSLLAHAVLTVIRARVVTPPRRRTKGGRG
jgi:SRSO17 transposase